jgi:hypothetical protein
MIPASVSLQDLRLPPSTRVLDLSVMRAKRRWFRSRDERRLNRRRAKWAGG